MARISAYPKHIPVQPEDYWIGTRASNLMTRNFTAKAVGEYINVSGSISMATCMLFKFKVTNAGPGDVTGVPNETLFSNITSLQINTLDVSDQDTVGFLEYIVGTEIIISEQNKISTFGHYSIDSYTQIEDTAFYTMNLTYIGGNGFIEHDMQYNICSFVLASEDTNTTYTLDSVQNGSNSDIRLIGSDLTENIVKLEAGTNVTLTDTGSNILIDVTGLGTVTSIDASIDGNSLSVAGVPITSSGTIAFNWQGTNLQYVDGEGNLQTFPTIPTGTVTSVGQTHAGNAFSVTGSPITTSGVLAITLNGNATQYIDGAGDLQTFPTIPVVPSNIVETVDTTNGTYIDLTPTTPTTGDVVVTADLSAVDGTGAPVGERYLSKNNKWETISSIPGTYEFSVDSNNGPGATIIESGDTFEVSGGTYLTGTLSVVANVKTIDIDHDLTSRTDTTSSDSPSYGGSFQAVKSVTTNATGHVTSIDVSTVTLPTSDDTTYDLTVPSGTTDITLLGSDASSDPVTLTGGTNIVVTRISDTEISIDGTDLNTTYDLEGVGSTNGTAGVRLAGSDATNDDVLIVGAGTTDVTRSANTLTVTSNDQFTGTVTSVDSSITGNAASVSGVPITTSGSIDFDWNGTNLDYVDGEGNLQTFPTIPTNIVETFSNNNTGTYVAYGVTNTSATGNINIGNVDLTAVDGTAIVGERYLTKSNTWATVASIPGTYEWSIAADSGGSETILSGDTVNFIGGTNVTTFYSPGGNELIINSTDQFQGTVTSVATTHAGNAFTASIGNIATINPSVDITMNGSSAEYVDGAGNLQIFPTIPQGDITDVNGGTYITTVNSTGPVVTVNHDLTSRTDTASTATPSAGGTITAVDSVTTNTTGHVEAINLKSVTLPTSSLTSESVDLLVKNISAANGGINLKKGDPVYIYGDVGASPRLYVDLADSDSTATNNLGDNKMPCVGLLDQDLVPNEEGTATVVGKLRNLITSPIDGATPNENDTIYVKSGGGLTLTKPPGSANLIQNVGQVGRVSTSNDGNIVVAALLRSNDVPNLPTGRLFVGTAANTSLTSNVVYIDDLNNRVGIGTNSPQEPLHIYSTGAGPVRAEIESTQAADAVLKYTNSNRSYATFLTQGGQFSIYDYNAASHRFYMLTNGNIGINTTTPSSKLHSVTTATGPIDYTQRAAILGINDSTDTTYANSVGVAGQVRTSGGYAIYGDAYGAGGWAGYFDGKGYFSGNVGINTTSPGATLEVTGRRSNTEAAFKVTDDGDRFFEVVPDFNTTFKLGDIEGLGDEPVIVGSYIDLKFNVAGNTTMTLETNNRVGIGITTPSQKLHVSGNARVTGAYYDSNNDPGTSGQILSSTVTGTDWIDGSAIPGVPAGSGTVNYLARWTPDNDTLGIGVTYDNGTNVGIGTTSPTALLTLESSSPNPGIDIKSTSYYPGSEIRFLNSSGGEVSTIESYENPGVSYLRLNYNVGSLSSTLTLDGGFLYLSTAGSERMRVTSNGNVGIGTTSPGEKLEVSGNIKTTTVTITEGTTVTYTGGGATYETLGTNVAFARESNGAMYNPLLNPGGWTYASRVQAPVGLLFNIDGWSNLTNIQERNYLNFVHALGNSVGNNIINTELIMWDYLNDNYYKLKFTAWGNSGAGGYTYQRTPLTINNKRSIATDTISTNKITVGDKINMPSGIRLASNINMGSPAQDRWADLLVDPGQSTVKIVTDFSDLDDDKITENYNVRIGHGVGNNTGTGVKYLSSNVLIGNNVAINATNTNTSSSQNVFIGYKAGQDLGQGDANYNVGIGQTALYNIQGGDYNTAIGPRAGYNVTDGSRNTFIGMYAGDNLTTGWNNTGLGFGADPSSSSVSDTITLGNSSITALRCQVTSITSLSDKRDKTNIEPSTYGLNVINKLNPVIFDWNMRDEGKVGDKDLGFIAQDLQEVDDENLKLVYDDNPEKLEASYGRLIPVMTKAIQELSAKIEILESKIQTLENK